MEFLAANIIGIAAMAVAILACVVPMLWNRIKKK